MTDTQHQGKKEISLNPHLATAPECPEGRIQVPFTPFLNLPALIKAVTNLRDAGNFVR